MAVRSAKHTDEDAIARLCSAAFHDDVLVGDLMHPKRNEYPEDFVDYFRRRVQKTGKEKSHVLLVSTTSDDAGNEVVTGFGDWIRQGETTKGGDHLTATTDPEVSKNRAADPKQIDVFERSAPFTKHHWTGPRAETWYLDLLAVHPDYQRRGFGRMLVEWGVRKANEDKVCASVIAAEEAEHLYQACGFKGVGWATEGEGNPLFGMRGGRIMFVDRQP